jgi:sec-independent protein translocase protein TatA
MWTEAALLFPIGLQELLIIGVLVVLIFGARKLPELGRGLGEGIRNFRKGLRSADNKEEAIEKPANKDSGDP